MIHDKDYMMRQVRHFSNFLSTLLLGKNEGKLQEEQVVFSTQMKNVFKMSFEELASRTKDDIITKIEQFENDNKIGYYELLGNIFYFKFKESGNSDFADKAKTFYEIWQQKSQIFSLTIVNRINELK